MLIPKINLSLFKILFSKSAPPPRKLILNGVLEEKCDLIRTNVGIDRNHLTRTIIHKAYTIFSRVDILIGAHRRRNQINEKLNQKRTTINIQTIQYQIKKYNRQDKYNIEIQY